MANNRLFLCDAGTKEYMLIATGWSGGWFLCDECVCWDTIGKFIWGSDIESAFGGGPTKLVLHTEQTLPADYTASEKGKRRQHADV